MYVWQRHTCVCDGSHCVSLISGLSIAPACDGLQAAIQGEVGECSYRLHKQSTPAGKYFVSGSAEFCPVEVEWVEEGSREVHVAGSFTEWKKQPLTERCVWVGRGGGGGVSTQTF